MSCSDFRRYLPPNDPRRQEVSGALWVAPSEIIKMVYNNVDEVPGLHGLKLGPPASQQGGQHRKKLGGGGAAAASIRGRRGGQWVRGQVEPKLLFTAVARRGYDDPA